MSPDQQCKQAGLNGSAELIELANIPKRTLYDWFHKEPAKFKLALDAALYRKGKDHVRLHERNA